MPPLSSKKVYATFQFKEITIHCFFHIRFYPSNTVDVSSGQLLAIFKLFRGNFINIEKLIIRPIHDYFPRMHTIVIKQKKKDTCLELGRGLQKCTHVNVLIIMLTIYQSYIRDSSILGLGINAYHNHKGIYLCPACWKNNPAGVPGAFDPVSSF